jgi:hypothetical protein
VSHPTGKKFPKLRGGTAESTLKFLLKFYDFLNDGEQGSILQNSVSAENFLDKFSSPNFGHVSTKKMFTNLNSANLGLILELRTKRFNEIDSSRTSQLRI